MDYKLFDSELKIMEVLWECGEVSAKKIAEILSKQTGWSKTTTYTVIKKCVLKGVVERSDPQFTCRALITREDVQEYETSELINKMYDGSPDKLVASIVGSRKLTIKDIEHLKALVEKL